MPSARRRVGDGAWGWLPALSLVGAVGLLIIALGFDAARTGSENAEPLFWVGLLTLFLPVAVRVASAAPSRRERIGLIVLLGLGLYLMKVMQYPLGAAYHDELGHLRSTDDIRRTGELFAENPIVQAYPFYPGLELVTDALSRISGMTIYSAGLWVVGAARVVFGIALFQTLAAIARSDRVAGVGALIYMGSPTFVFFDALFAYESLALPLAALLLAVVIAWRGRGRGLGDRSAIVLATVLALALVATHHLTAYAVIGFLALWTVVHLVARRGSLRRPPVVVLAVAAAAAAAWLIFVSQGATGNLVGIVERAFTSLGDLAPGGSGGEKELFTSGTGEADPLLERLLGFGAVGLILAVLPFGLLGLWRQRRRLGALPLVLGLVALSYPGTLLLRLTSSGTEISSRVSAYVFLGLALVIGIAAVNLWLTNRRVPSWVSVATVAVYTSVLFVGGIIVGLAPDSRLPGPYLVGADPRSVEPEGIAAARWARAELGEGQRVTTDLTNSLLMASYGRQETVRGSIDGVPVPTLFFSTRFGEAERSIIAGEDLDYVVVDARLSTSLPRTGRYFDGVEPDRPPGAGPIEPQAIAKFDAADGADRVYDSGAIRMYDVREIAGSSR